MDEPFDRDAMRLLMQVLRHSCATPSTATQIRFRGNYRIFSSLALHQAVDLGFLQEHAGEGETLIKYSLTRDGEDFLDKFWDTYPPPVKRQAT